MNTQTCGFYVVNLQINKTCYKSVILKVLKNLFSNLILGHGFQKQHKSLQIRYRGLKLDFIIPNYESVYAFSAISVSEHLFFPNLFPNCKPIISKSQQFGKADRDFIRNEVKKLLQQGIFEKNSPLPVVKT